MCIDQVAPGDRDVPSASNPGPSGFVAPLEMQHRLFAELSRMFGAEVPMYERSLRVNEACNRTACAVLALRWPGFEVTDEQLARDAAERHGAIRLGRPDEMRWIARFFRCFDMHPHGFYDMSSVGAKSQPVVATAFRSRVDPEHRVFTSLLRTDCFGPSVRPRIEALLADRDVLGDRARVLIERAEAQGGLDRADADALVAEATSRIFKWTGRARDHALYEELCAAGFKIAADIACFERHHLNHLTPNTLCMDLFTAAMKHRLGEEDEGRFRDRARRALGRLLRQADLDWMRLHFRHRPEGELDALAAAQVPAAAIDAAAVEHAIDALLDRLATPELDLARLHHHGFKDATEGPSAEVPVLLRQDAYRALTEPVVFVEADGTEVAASHTARFGEIEQRFFACTPAGRDLYDRCLERAEAVRAEHGDLARTDPAAFEAQIDEAFAPFPRTLAELFEAGLVHARVEPTPAGLAARRTAGPDEPADVPSLLRRGLVRLDGLRYEDFLPVSAAGIFASNLDRSPATVDPAERTEYTPALLEQVLGMSIVDPATAYRAAEAASILETLERLGVLERLGAAERGELERAATAAAAGPRETVPAGPA